MTSRTGKAGRLDWEALKLRLRRVQEAHDKAGQADVLRRRRERVLEERARLIAGRQGPDEPAGESLLVLEFSLALERYALEAGPILEVHPLRDYTPVPGAPPHVLGVVNVRGRIFSVLDIKVFFGIPTQALTDLNKAILLQGGGMSFAVLADAVLAVRPLPTADILPPPPTLTGIRERYLRGVTRDGLIVLDADRLLSDEGLVVRDSPLPGVRDREGEA